MNALDVRYKFHEEIATLMLMVGLVINQVRQKITKVHKKRTKVNRNTDFTPRKINTVQLTNRSKRDPAISNDTNFIFLCINKRTRVVMNKESTQTSKRTTAKISAKYNSGCHKRNNQNKIIPHKMPITILNSNTLPTRCLGELFNEAYRNNHSLKPQL